MSFTIKVNGETREVDVEPDTPLLWAIRDSLGLTGTKFGCGIQQCGACTVHVNGQPTRSCGVLLESVEGAEITTIEGISDDASTAVQQAWIEADVPQCGYCQSGMVMAATALLEENPDPSDEEIDSAMTNICRCGTYTRIRSAIKAAAQANKA